MVVLCCPLGPQHGSLSGSQQSRAQGSHKVVAAKAVRNACIASFVACVPASGLRSTMGLVPAPSLFGTVYCVEEFAVVL